VIGYQIKQYKCFKWADVLQPEQVIIPSQPNGCIM